MSAFATIQLENINKTENTIAKICFILVLCVGISAPPFRFLLSLYTIPKKGHFVTKNFKNREFGILPNSLFCVLCNFNKFFLAYITMNIINIITIIIYYCSNIIISNIINRLRSFYCNIFASACFGIKSYFSI